jgi:hypothetical protein
LAREHGASRIAVVGASVAATLAVGVAACLLVGAYRSARYRSSAHDMLQAAGLTPTTVFSAVEYTTDFMVVHHIEFGTPLDYSRGLPEVYRLAAPRDEALIGAMAEALRNCRECAVRFPLANSDALCLRTRDGRALSLAVAVSSSHRTVYFDHCRYQSDRLYDLIEQITSRKTGLGRRRWCE